MKSLYAAYEPQFHNNEFELIIVDNASGDGSVRVLQEAIKKEKYTNVIVIENKSNEGFSKGCNLGAKDAKGEKLIFLNNDTVVKGNAIREMVRLMDTRPEIAILGGKLTNPDGSDQPSVGKFYTPWRVTLLMLGLQRFALIDKNPAKIVAVDWVKGALLMIRRKLFNELNGFDEHIFMYTEDMELCYRAAQKGYKSFFYPSAEVIHEEAGSSNRTFAIVNIYTNLLYFYKKHRTHGEYLYLKSLLRTKAVVLMGIGRLLGNSYLVQTYEKAFKVT